MKKFNMAVLITIIIFILIVYFNEQDSDLIRLDHITELEIIHIKSSETIKIKYSTKLDDVINIINRINTSKSDGTYNDEKEILYQIYTHTERFYPEGPISIAQNKMIFKNKIYSLNDSDYKALISLVTLIKP